MGLLILEYSKVAGLNFQKNKTEGTTVLTLQLAVRSSHAPELGNRNRLCASCRGNCKDAKNRHCVYPIVYAVIEGKVTAG